MRGPTSSAWSTGNEWPAPGTSSVSTRGMTERTRVSSRRDRCTWLLSASMRSVYFGTKAELLHAANRHVADRASARLMRRLAALGADAEPRRIVHTVVDEFLPTDKPRREAMLLFFAFYTAQMTDPALARGEAAGVPQGLAALVAGQIRRAQASGDAPTDIDPDREGAILTAAIPGLASGVLVNYVTASAAAAILDYAVDQIFAPR